MHAVIITQSGGEMIWHSTHDNLAEAQESANETMLRSEECVFVIRIDSFRQEL
jgi:hypothetical protein